jgi:hypothetical protein
VDGEKDEHPTKRDPRILPECGKPMQRVDAPQSEEFATACPSSCSVCPGPPTQRVRPWFQAQEACGASGKRLPTGAVWLRAASGTNDPGANDGTGGACVTNASGPRATGQGTTCPSAWGALDTVGNVLEWTADWYAGAGSGSAIVNNGVPNWPSEYNGDVTVNVETLE